MQRWYSKTRAYLLSSSHVWLGIYFAGWILFFASFWARALYYDAQGNLMAGHINIWGDWAAHFTMGSAMGYRELFLTHSPFLIGAKFSYPFIANLLAGVLIRFNIPFIYAFILPSFLFSVLTVFSLYFFYKALFHSPKIAVLASLIFLLNGGVGFVFFARDIAFSPQPLDTFINPLHEYTRLDDENLKWISVIDSMIIPQRAFTLGFPLAVIVLTLIYQSVMNTVEKSHQDWRVVLTRLMLAGLILGWLPLFHTHSFLALGVILPWWAVASGVLAVGTKKIWSWFWRWSVVGLCAAPIAGLLFIFFFFNQVSDGFLKWYPGWLAKEFGMNWLLFWFKNWGITPLVGLLGYWYWVTRGPIFLKKKLLNSVVSAGTFLPFWLLFIMANLWLFQPFSWDNTKLLAWASLGISGLAAYAIAVTLRRYAPAKTSKKWWLKIRHYLAVTAAVACFLIMILSGTIDAYRIQRIQLHSYQMYTAEELQLATWTKTHTPIGAVWLTGDQHNHWLFNLTGRQSILTYRGWLWTHGYDYLTQEHDVIAMLTDPHNNAPLFTKYGISYVVIGPNEIIHWDANEVAFHELFTPVQETENYTIFQVSY